MLKEAWSPLWNRPEPDTARIHQYLHRYDKKINFLPPPIDLNSVRKALLRPKSSDVGPDGLPFVCYRKLVDVAAPLFLDYVHHLEQGGAPHRSFNFANMYFSPKVASPTPLQVRPLSVTNTDNRLISSMVRRGLTPALFDVLCKTQRASRPGGGMSELIQEANGRFQEALKAKRPCHRFFHDLFKAYDLASRRCMMILLHMLGVPDTYLNIIKSLFVKNRVFPLMADSHKITIDIGNGLKQGDPFDLFRVH